RPARGRLHGADRQSPRGPRRPARHYRDLRRHGARIARSGGNACRREYFNRSNRSAHASAARRGDDTGKREKDVEGDGGARGHQDRRPGGEITALINEHVFEYLDGPVVRVTAPDTPVPFSPPLEEAFLPNAAKITEKARWLARY